MKGLIRCWGCFLGKLSFARIVRRFQGFTCRRWTEAENRLYFSNCTLIHGIFPLALIFELKQIAANFALYGALVINTYTSENPCLIYVSQPRVWKQNITYLLTYLFIYLLSWCIGAEYLLLCHHVEDGVDFLKMSEVKRAFVLFQSSRAEPLLQWLIGTKGCCDPRHSASENRDKTEIKPTAEIYSFSGEVTILIIGLLGTKINPLLFSRWRRARLALRPPWRRILLWRTSPFRLLSDGWCSVWKPQ